MIGDFLDRVYHPHPNHAMQGVGTEWLTGFDVPCLHTICLDKPASANLHGRAAVQYGCF
jgi:hypothetical protein